MSLLAIPDILRAAGCKVQLAETWPSTPLGPMRTDTPAIVWHHDGSPVGPSPGGLSWITTSYAAGQPSAQLWVDTEGTWWCIGPGLAWHTGAVLPGMPDNYSACGVETDHTIGEPWPTAQLASLRKGTAALLKAWGRTATDGLFFHKQIASPVGRKPDPDGLDLDVERRAVAALMAPPVSTPTTKPTTDTPTPDLEIDMDEKMLRKLIREEATAATRTVLLNTPVVGTKNWTLPLILRELGKKAGVIK